MSRCPKCNWHSFALVEIEPNGSEVKLNAIVCAQCRSVVGVTDWYAVGRNVAALARQVTAIEAQLSRIDRVLQVIAHNQSVVANAR